MKRWREEEIEFREREQVFPIYFLKLAAIPLGDKLATEQFSRLFGGEIAEEHSPLTKPSTKTQEMDFKTQKIHVRTSSASQALNSELFR